MSHFRLAPALIAIGLGVTACQVTTPARVATTIAQDATTPGASAAAPSPATAVPAASGQGVGEQPEGGSGGTPAAPSTEPAASPSPKFGNWASFSGVVVHVRLPGSGLPYRVQGMASGIERVEVRISGVANLTQTLSPGPADTQLDFSFPGLWDTSGYHVAVRALNASGTVLAESDRLHDLDAAGHVRRDLQGRPLTWPGDFSNPPNRELVLQLTLGTLNTKVTL